jgi:serine protease
MAAPHVAAAASLLVSHGVTDPEKVRKYLMNSASKAASDSSERYGAGIVNAEAALKSAFWRRKLQTMIFAILVYYIVWVILNRGRSKIERVPFSLLAFLGLAAGATGFFFFQRIPFIGDSFWVTHSFNEWTLAIPAGKAFYASPLLLSFLPALLIALLLYPWKRLVPLAMGVSIGLAAFLAINGSSPNMDISWVPGRFLDSVWLELNALICIVVSIIASFRLK